VFQEKKVLLTCESQDKKAGYIVMESVDGICHLSVYQFVRKHLKRVRKVHSDILSALNIVEKAQNYEAIVTPSYLVDGWMAVFATYNDR
jgi:hypothetical protein